MDGMHQQSQLQYCPKCGIHPLKSLVVQKENANKGRPFTCCEDDDCNYFAWTDGNQGSNVPRKRQRHGDAQTYGGGFQKIGLDDLSPELRELMEFVIVQRRLCEDA